MASHSPLLITLMVANMAAFLLNMVFSFFNIVDTEKVLGFKNIFPKSISAVSDSTYIEITPTSDTFSIWGFIYIWQVVWMIYALVNTCRRAPDGPVYTSPTLLTPTFFVVSILNWLCVITWLFVVAYDQLWVAFVFLALCFITIYICIGLSYRALDQHMGLVIQQKRKHEIWLVRAFVQNGLAFYGAWCTIATPLNLASALSYDHLPKLAQSTSSTIALSIVTVELIVFTASDWTVMDKYSRYTVSPYIVIIVALYGSIANNWNPEKTNSIFTAVLLAVAAVCMVVKVVLMLYRHCRDSKRQDLMLPTTQEKHEIRM